MKYLIIKTSALGDIVHCYPLVHFLKAQNPACQIDWVVEEASASLVQSHPQIDRVLLVNTKAWRKNIFKRSTWQQIQRAKQAISATEYDAVFDLQGNCKSALFTSWSRSKNKVGFSWKSVPEWPNLFATNRRFDVPQKDNIRARYLSIVTQFFGMASAPIEERVTLCTTALEEETIERLLAAIQAPAKVMVCPGSAWINKQMTEEALANLLQSFRQYLRCTYLFIWGNEREKEVAERLQQQFPRHSVVVERLSLPALQNLMQKMDLVISMDSLPLHLAGTAGCKTFSVFGPSSAAVYKPVGEQHLAFQGPCPYGKKFDKRCPILRTCKTGACIHSLNGHEVFKTSSL